MSSSGGLLNFITIRRAHFSCTKRMVRLVHVSDLVNKANGKELSGYFREHTPFFYREMPNVISGLKNDGFVSTIKETLARLPTIQSFRESHFGEIATCIFAEDVMGLQRLYSKLSLLTTENMNANKMDLVMYRPGSNPVEFIIGEVKSSPKTAADGLPAKHDDSCFADIFNSMNKYQESDLDFDLTAAKDHIELIPEPERTRVRDALKPYGDKVITYAGFAIIDLSTKADDETTVLATRQNKKTFDIDLICVEGYPDVAESVYKKLEELRQVCSS